MYEPHRRPKSTGKYVYTSVQKHASVVPYDPSFPKQYQACWLAWSRTMPAPLGPKMWMVYAGRTAAICCDFINMHQSGNHAATHLLFCAFPFCPVVMTAYLAIPRFICILRSPFKVSSRTKFSSSNHQAAKILCQWPHLLGHLCGLWRHTYSATQRYKDRENTRTRCQTDLIFLIQSQFEAKKFYTFESA